MLSEKVDVIILLTGDGDFCPLVEYLHGHGVMVEVVAFGESTNAQLRTICDSFTDLSQARQVLLRSRRSTSKHDEGEEESTDHKSHVKISY
jgi:uncharacterized LabA/DUF88 family protein